MNRKKFSKVKKIIYAAVFALLAFGILIAGAMAYWMATLKIPDFESFENRKVIQSTKIYDRTGKILLWDVHENIKRTVVPLDEISRNLKNATVAIEDSTFYHHHGVDFTGIIRAFLVNLGRGSLRGQGGSTISQQVIKNTVLTTEKSYVRKIKELILTLKMEQHLSKDKILEIYLNEIPYGGSTYGIEAASQNFFGKSAEELTLAESAYLAALPQAPTYYSPFGNHTEELETRKNLVLKRMFELGFITEDEKTAGEKEKVKFTLRGDQSVKAPHFSIYVRSYLEEKYGKDVVEEGGLKVITTLDYDLQAKAEDMAKKYAEENKIKFSATNDAMIGVDPKTGQILVMVGSKDYFNAEEEGNFNITLAHRQPGSSIKPFVYATAFKKGYTPDTVVFDLKTEFNVLCNPDGTPAASVSANVCYSPQNADMIYKGPLTLREALAQSRNVPSVKVLYLAGIKESIETAKDMGITSLTDPARYGLTLVLGGGEVSPLEMASAYGVFANDGIKNPHNAILRIENSHGDVLEEFSPKPTRVINENIARIINDILTDEPARAPVFGSHSHLYIPDYDVAVKTGTTNDFRDAWVIGYTPNFVLGVWIGNNDNSPMEFKTASIIGGPLWNAYFKEILPLLPKENFPEPQPQYPEANKLKPFLRGDWRGGITYSVDKISGKLATEFTPLELIEQIPLLQVHSILHWLNKDDPLGPVPEEPQNDPQCRLWEQPVRAWAQRNGVKEQTMADIPKDYDDIHKPEFAPKINVSSPSRETIYNPSNAMVIQFACESKFGLEQVDFFLNGTYLGSARNQPFNFSFIPAAMETREDSEIKIVAYDKMRNKSETTIPVKFNSAFEKP